MLLCDATHSLQDSAARESWILQIKGHLPLPSNQESFPYHLRVASIGIRYICIVAFEKCYRRENRVMFRFKTSYHHLLNLS